MMSFAVLGLRSVFQLPVSLTANWVLRITQLCSPQKLHRRYPSVAAAPRGRPGLDRLGLFIDSFSAVHHVVAHLVVLALYGWALIELGLIDFYKVPFTCSYLPGKSNIQYVFWGVLVVLLIVVMAIAEFEQRSFTDPVLLFRLLIVFAAVPWALGLQSYQANSAVLYFEELPEDVILPSDLLHRSLQRPTHRFDGIAPQAHGWPNERRRPHRSATAALLLNHAALRTQPPSAASYTSSAS